MEIELRVSDDDVERIARRVIELQGSGSSPSAWLTVAGAADHLGTTEQAVRGLVKRNQVPVHRTESGRLRFSRTELDDWVRGGTCAT